MALINSASQLVQSARLGYWHRIPRGDGLPLRQGRNLRQRHRQRQSLGQIAEVTGGCGTLIPPNG